MKTVISTENAPAAVGPYSQAMVVEGGELVFTAGNIALDPVTGKMVEGDVAAETAQVLKNLEAVLEGAGTGLLNVVKTTVYLQDMGDFAVMNEVYGNVFSQHPPARTTVEVAALPLGARVEIEAVAVRPVPLIDDHDDVLDA